MLLRVTVIPNTDSHTHNNLKLIVLKITYVRACLPPLFSKWCLSLKYSKTAINN